MTEVTRINSKTTDYFYTYNMESLTMRYSCIVTQSIQYVHQSVSTRWSNFHRTDSDGELIHLFSAAILPSVWVGMTTFAPEQTLVLPK